MTVLGLNDFHGNLEATAFSGVQGPDPANPGKTKALLAGGVGATAQKIDPAVGSIISGHTHQGDNGLVPDPDGKDRIVIEGNFYGHLL